MSDALKLFLCFDKSKDPSLKLPFKSDRPPVLAEWTEFLCNMEPNKQVHLNKFDLFEYNQF